MAIRAALFLGLIVSHVAMAISSAWAVEIREETITEIHKLDPDGTFTISNTDGTIRIYGGNEPEVSVRAIKKAYSDERLKQIVVEIKATPKSVSIETIFP